MLDFLSQNIIQSKMLFYSFEEFTIKHLMCNFLEDLLTEMQYAYSSMYSTYYVFRGV